MTTRHLFATSIAALVLFGQGCSSNSTSPSSTPNGTSSVGLSAKINGAPWVPVNVIATKSYQTITIGAGKGSGMFNMDTLDFSFTSLSDTSTGKPNSHGGEYMKGTTSYTIDGGTITITKQSKTHVEGTFLMTGYPFFGSDSAKITDGQFNLDIK